MVGLGGKLPAIATLEKPVELAENVNKNWMLFDIIWYLHILEYFSITAVLGYNL